MHQSFLVFLLLLLRGIKGQGPRATTNVTVSHFFIFLWLIQTFIAIQSQAIPLFREYIGAEGNNVTFSEVPINPNVDFHFILSFAIDYTYSTPPRPTNGNFRVVWDDGNLNISQISLIKKTHPNVKFAMSLGGDTINTSLVQFDPLSISSWVQNAEYSITRIVKEYDLDGIDIDYEHFNYTRDTNTFSECIGGLLSNLKQKRIISFASIAPYDNVYVQPFYLALWNKYGHLIDYVNFQFYAYPKIKSSALFLQYFETQSLNYKGGKIIVSFGTDGSGGLSPNDGFFDACKVLHEQGKFYGIFIWSADDSKKAGFLYEKKSQDFLATLLK